MLDYWNSSVQQSFDAYRTSTRVVARIPNESDCPTCGWDPINQSAKDMQCPTCNGIGKIIAWKDYAINARLSWDPLRFAYPYPSSGAETGDCIIVVSPEWTAVLDLVMNEERAYIHADDKIVRPKFKHEQRVTNLVMEVEYVCNLYTPST